VDLGADGYPHGVRFVTDDVMNAALDRLRVTLENGLASVRAEVAAARAESAEGHYRLREDITDRLSEAVEARVRIQVLEEGHKTIIGRVDGQEKASVETRRFLIVQLLASAGLILTVIAVVWKH